jgi:hypothetical protein
VSDIFGCDIVTHRLDRDGYAFHGKTRAHIVAWMSAHGPVPDGMVIDHACRRRACKAVHHLEAVTESENQKRKSFAYLVKRKKCQRGHDMEINRVITPERGVVCRQCNKEAA